MQTICTKKNSSTEKFLPPPPSVISNGPPLRLRLKGNKILQTNKIKNQQEQPKFQMIQIIRSAIQNKIASLRLS